MNKVFIIGTTGLPANYGGFETLAENLVERNCRSFNFEVFCSTVHYKNTIFEKNDKYKRINLPFSANGVSSILYDALSILIAGFKARKKDSLLLLGTSGAWIIPFVKPFISAQVVVNVDGIEWRRSKFNRFGKLVLKVLESIAVNSCDLIICDNLVIDRYIRKRYNCRTKIIAYGGDCGYEIDDKAAERNENYALAICRIEPENNVHLILEGASRTNTNLVFVGNWDASEYGRKLKAKFKSWKKFKLLDPIYDQATLHELRQNCYVYLHGHVVGGSNPSLIEMMFYEKPIIAYGCMFNKCTLDGNGWFFKSMEELEDMLSIFDNEYTDDHLLKCKNALEYAKENYTWNKISGKYYEIFEK